MDKKYVKVLVVLRDTTLEALGLKRGQGYEDRHFVKRDKKGNPVYENRVRVECEVGDKSVSNRPNEDILPFENETISGGKRFYELQLTEGSSPNTATIITGEKGEKLEPRWTNKSVGGFRTVKGALLAIEYRGLQETGTIYRYSFISEDKTFYLRKEYVGAFKVKGTEVEGDKERPLIEWLNNPFTGLEGEKALVADENITAAIQAAIDRSSHNCFHPKRGCEYPHYALTVEEIKKRRQEARVKHEAERKEKEEARKQQAEKRKAAQAVAAATRTAETPADSLSFFDPGFGGGNENAAEK